MGRSWKSEEENRGIKRYDSLKDKKKAERKKQRHHIADLEHKLLKEEDIDDDEGFEQFEKYR
jgi:hypothetical protein